MGNNVSFSIYPNVVFFFTVCSRIDPLVTIEEVVTLFICLLTVVSPTSFLCRSEDTLRPVFKTQNCIPL